MSSSFGPLRGGAAGRGTAGRARPLCRPLRVEPLEDRRLLANVTVSRLTDVVDGNTASIAALVGSPGADGGISLREAIMAANVDNTDVMDTISFAPSVTGTIQLTNTGHVGQLVISSDLTINGPGAGVLTIRAFAGTAAVGDGSRIFRVDDGNAGTFKNVILSGLTITGGDRTLTDGSDGGGILNSENLTLVACTISDNVLSSGGTSRGGGIFSSSGSLTIIQSTVSGNTARRGGGIFSDSLNATITDSTISGNTASSTSGDGGGGVIAADAMTISNSTISGNVTNANGGGVLNSSPGVLTVRHSTITGNRADADNSSGGEGGGIYSTYAATSLDHTILAGNLNGVSARSDLAGGAVTARYSLIGDNTGATITGNDGNQIGMGASPINAALGPLADNGGATFTHALLAGSPAVDAGDPVFSAPPMNDQRGAAFGRIADGDGIGGARIDIGAYESQPDGALGDYNRDGGVNAADYVMWRKLFGTSVTPPFVGADGDGDSTVDAGDYGVWRENFGEALGGSGGAAEIKGETGRVGEGEMKSSKAVEQQGNRDGDRPRISGFGLRIGASRDSVALEPIRKPPAEGGQSQFAPKTPQIRDSPRRLSDKQSLSPHPSLLPEAEGTNHDAALAAWLESRAMECGGEQLEFELAQREEMNDSLTLDSLAAVDAALGGLVIGV